MQSQTSYAEVLKLVNRLPARDKVGLISQMAPQIEKELALLGGVSGQHLVKFAETISPESAQEMSDAIDAACEQVDQCEGSCEA